MKLLEDKLKCLQKRKERMVDFFDKNIDKMELELRKKTMMNKRLKLEINSLRETGI